MKHTRLGRCLRWLIAAAASAGCGLFGYERLELTALPGAGEHCNNQLLDGDELGVDCGGPSCAACALGVACTPGPGCSEAPCLDPSCAPPPSCADGVQNQDEVAVDCGGVACAPCPSCSDGAQNQDETGIDCGGATCAACPTCSDGVQNQDETGVDCGGACSACITCSDGIQNQDETGVDCGGSRCIACGLNTPPLARLTVTPGVGVFDAGVATVFAADGSASSDLQDALGALSFSWDWDNDGVADASGPTSSHSYGSAGTYEVRLTVQDTGGLSASATFLVIVTAASDLVQVTTAADEGDVGATPGNPLGSGFSLREAIQYANATAGRQSILVPAGFEIALDSQLPNPTDDAGVDIVGDGASWDGSGTGPADDCILVPAAQTRIFGVELRNCRRSPLRLAFGAAGSQFSRLKIRNFGVPVILNDANVVFGPDNEVSGGATDCIDVVGGSASLLWNSIDDCGARGIDLTGSSSGALVLGNIISRCNTGTFLGNGANNCSLLHNVFHANGGDGVWLGGVVNSGSVLRNNIFSNNAGFGTRADNAPFASNDHNAYFGNVAGACSGCGSLGTGSTTSDPELIDAAARDFRLSPSSPLIDAGFDTLHDVNGSAPGNGLFNGAAPDIGAREMN